MLMFNFDAQAGETPASIAQKRALVAQIMGSQKAPATLGEGFSAIGDGIVANVLGGRAQEGQRKGDAEGADVQARLFAAITGQGAPNPSYGAPATGGAAPSSGAMSSFSGDQEEFVNAIMPGAIAASQRTGIDPRIIVAQAAQESGWGKHAPGNNLFGIKSHGQPGGQSLMTNEEVNGQNVRVRDSFRSYDSPDASISGYADFMLQNPRYRPLMEAQGLDAQLQALGASGYATDSNYANSVGSIARGLNLPDMASTPANAATALSGGIEGAFPQVGAQQAQLPPIGPAGGPPMTAQAPAPMQPQPMQPTMQPQQGADMSLLLEAISNPWVPESTKALAMQELQRLQQQNDPRYQQELRAGDLGIQKSEFELNQMLNPPPAKPEYGFTQLSDGTFVRTDKTSGTFDQLGQFTAPEAPTSNMKDYDAYAADEVGAGRQPLDRLAYEKAVRSSGATNITNTLGGESLTPGQKKIDESFAETYLDWNSGGYADADKMMTQLNESLGILESGQDVTGTIGLLPDQLRPFFNEQGAIAKENVEEVVQRSLREILGAQFTEKEGERLIARAFNDKLPPAENAKRVRRLIDTIQGMAHSKQGMVDYWDEHGTLRGYKGPRPNRSQLDNLDFGDAAGASSDPALPEAGGEPSAEFLKWSGDPDLWNFMTPEQRALW